MERRSVYIIAVIFLMAWGLACIAGAAVLHYLWRAITRKRGLSYNPAVTIGLTIVLLVGPFTFFYAVDLFYSWRFLRACEDHTSIKVMEPPPHADVAFLTASEDCGSKEALRLLSFDQQKLLEAYYLGRLH